MRSASMPPAAGNGLEPGFRGVICVSFGSTGDTAVPDTDGQPRYDLHFEAATADSLSELTSVINSSRVGARLVLAGPPTDIRAAAAVAADCGGYRALTRPGVRRMRISSHRPGKNKT